MGTRIHGNEVLERLRARALGFAALTLAAVAIAGCGETKPSHFYLLSSVVESSRAEQSSRNTGHDATLGVGPVELPKYLDRVQIVSFSTQNRVDISEFDRWAEPLNDNFTRVLGENLSAQLPSVQVDTYPFPVNAPRDFERQVLVDVAHFRLTPSNKVELRADWKVLDSKRRLSLTSGTFATLEPVESAGTEAVVAAMSRAVGALSRDIGTAVKGTFKGD